MDDYSFQIDYPVAHEEEPDRNPTNRDINNGQGVINTNKRKMEGNALKNAIDKPNTRDDRQNADDEEENKKLGKRTGSQVTDNMTGNSQIPKIKGKKVEKDNNRPVRK